MKLYVIVGMIGIMNFINRGKLVIFVVVYKSVGEKILIMIVELVM